MLRYRQELTNLENIEISLFTSEDILLVLLDLVLSNVEQNWAPKRYDQT